MPCRNNVAANPGGNGMGIGRLGDGDIIHKRKYRWVLTIFFCHGRSVPPHFVKTASRPDISIEETEINFLNEKTWIPGKAAWEAITVTYYDVAVSNDDNIELFSWLASVYDFMDETCRWQNSKRSDYAGLAALDILDGCGNILEGWTLEDMWPTSIKFGDLDYSSSETLDIELTLRYSKVQYLNFCGQQPKRCPCSKCAQPGQPAAELPRPPKPGLGIRLPVSIVPF